jgi:hypothetical protein
VKLVRAEDELVTIDQLAKICLFPKIGLPKDEKNMDFTQRLGPKMVRVSEFDLRK